jgi:hypothetical protein
MTRSWRASTEICGTSRGFHYDFQRAEPFSPEDLERIEKRRLEPSSVLVYPTGYDNYHAYLSEWQ